MGKPVTYVAKPAVTRPSVGTLRPRQGSALRRKATSRPVLLTVDDDARIHDSFRTIFGNDCEVLEARDASSAIKILTSRAVDLVLLDLLMPRMNGFAVLERARALRRDAKVIVVTAVDTASTAVAAMRLGALEYVTKPFDPISLELLVWRALADPAAPSAFTPPQTPGRPRHVWVVGGKLGARASLAVTLGNDGQVVALPTVAAALTEISPALPDLMIVDLASAGGGHAGVLEALRARFPEGPLILTSTIDRPGVALELAVPERQVVFLGSVTVAALLEESANLLSAKPGLTPPRRFSLAIMRVIEQVSRAYSETTAERLARGSGLSPRHLSRTFGEEMGMSVKRYLTRVRAEIGTYLLGETREKLDAIAAMVGLYDAAHLARVFRRLGLGNPGLYRKR